MRICSSLDANTAMQNTLDYLKKFIPLTGLNLIMAEPGLPAFITLARVTRYKRYRIKKADRMKGYPLVSSLSGISLNDYFTGFINRIPVIVKLSAPLFIGYQIMADPPLALTK